LSKSWRESWEELEEFYEQIEKGISEVKRTRKFQKFKSLKPRGKRLVRKAKGMGKPRRFTKPKPTIPTERAIQKMDIVISARGRPLSREGQAIPFEAPAAGMPVSKQDYFLTSRAIMKASWDPNKKIMELKFTSGAVYNFYNISEIIWTAFINAGSKGRFFIYRIRPYPNKYPYIRVS